MTCWLSIVVAAPAHSAIAGPLTYRSASPLTPGTLVRVPLGRREVLGVVWQVLPDSGGLADTQTRSIAGALDALAPLTATWQALVSFTARYYQRSLGEVALAALPPSLRELTGVQLARRLKRPVQDTRCDPSATDLIALSPDQLCAMAGFDAEAGSKPRPVLLFGATGSGKTEIYLRAAAQVLAQDSDAQVLVMVPEINLTPQLQARFETRFAHLGKERVVSLHSGLSSAQRLKSWLAAHSGMARLILGTRMAVLASMPRLRLIVVDEEHDPSYKQQEGARYSARDLAVYRASIEPGCRVLLGSATPSLESWQAAISGKYQLLTMAERIGAPTLSHCVWTLPPEGAAAPAVWQSQSRGPCLQGDISLQPAVGQSQSCGPGLQGDISLQPAVGQGQSCGPGLQGDISLQPAVGQSQSRSPGLQGDISLQPAVGQGQSRGPGLQGDISLQPAVGQGQSRGPGLQGDISLQPAVGQSQSRGPGLQGGIPPHSALPLKGGLPVVKGIDMNHQPRHCVIAPPLVKAIQERIARGEQSLIFLNRRGYAPVLACHDCGWKSECPHCSAYRVFHKIDRTLRCHHCGFTERVPRACPTCGNIDIAPVGRGTERLEEHLAELLAATLRPDGSEVRIARIDADTTRLKGALQAQLASVHAGEVDVLVGTQMIAKGHDFRHITLVAAINPDGALFSSDFRAPERLFSLLMQAAGRAGRDARHSATSEMWVQTFHPQHPLFAALKLHDYPLFAAQQLEERCAAGLSPFGFSALVRAEAKTQEVAQGFLNAASSAALAAPLEGHDHITAYPAVPMTIQRVANIERAQMLVESASRPALQRFLAAWQPVLFETRKQSDFKSLIRWAIDVDPLAI